MTDAGGSVQAVTDAVGRGCFYGRTGVEQEGNEEVRQYGNRAIRQYGHGCITRYPLLVTPSLHHSVTSPTRPDPTPRAGYRRPSRWFPYSSWAIQV
jgi:hypothetical protein